MLIILFPKALIAAPVYPILGAVGIFLIIKRLKTRKEPFTRDSLKLPVTFTSVANKMALMMLLAICVYAGINSFRIAREAGAIASGTSLETAGSSIAKPRTRLPHIIHIVLDGYSREDILRRTYGFDNTPFLNALKRRGFRISDQATTPFNQTLPVMSSVFSLGRVTDALTTAIDEQDDVVLRRTLARVQQHGTVSMLLEDLGYTLVSTPSAYLPLNWEILATTSGDLDTIGQLQDTKSYIFAYDLLDQSPILGDAARSVFSTTFSADSVNFQILQHIPHRRFHSPDGGPPFVYQHILAPHPPFNITADGKRRPFYDFSADLSDGSHLHESDAARRRSYRSGYVDKLRYINGAILDQIDGLTKTLTGPLIVILHGDHGGGLHFDQDNKSATCVGERFSPLLAVYATDERVLDGFTSDFNIINIYRVIFRNLLGADIPKLSNQSTFISWDLNSLVDINLQDLSHSCGDLPVPTIAEHPAADDEDAAVSR